jgi:hypothetical protein
LIEKCIYSPQTRSTCVSESLAFILSLNKNYINRYAHVKKRATRLHKKYNCEKGISFEKLEEISNEFDIPIYDWKTDEKKVNKPGFIV